MDYIEAVELAKSGDDAGFNFLYQETYKSKYYLALKYMQNEEAAKDVVQDAYIRAFEKLDTLESPEKFAAWLGMIVANTAKNALQKQNPTLFTDVAKDSDEEAFEYQIEDESVQSQPEIAYSQKETQELVRELIDTLPEEQRLCILMFHIEGQSIREIAEALDCSENTVKSRLNYGRKNIKFRAEELQKKGYKLYTVAPLPFILYLLQSEEQAMAAQGVFDVAGKAMADNIAKQTAHKSLLQSAGAKGAAGAVKQGFIHTLAGKITVAVLGVCIVGAGAAAVVVNSQKNDEPEQNIVTEETDAEEDAGMEENTAEEENREAELEAEPEEAVVEVTDAQYPELLAGGLTKEQFEFALGYGPEYMSNGQVSMEDLRSLLLRIAMDGKYHNIGIESIGEAGGKPLYRLADINNFISVLTDYQYSEQNNASQMGNEVSGDTLSVVVAEPASSNYVTIQEAKLKGDKMTVKYQIETKRFSDDTGEEEITMTNKVAVLHKIENGRYRVTDITDAMMAEGCREAYILALENLYTNYIWPDGTVMDFYGDISQNQFAVYDIDGDGEEELIIEYTTSSMAGMEEAVFGYDNEAGIFYQEFRESPGWTFYDNGFIRADASHNQGGDSDAWPYTMYQYDEGTDAYVEVGTGVTNDGSIEGYVGNGKEINPPFLNLSEENIQSIR